MGTDREIEVAILIIAALTLVVVGIGVYFAYPAWREYRLTPLLRISLRPDGEGPLMVVNNNGRGQIVFLLTLHNGGDRAARFWRVWLAGQDKDTTIFLDKSYPSV